MVQSALYSLELEGANAMIWRKVTLSIQPSARFGHTLTPVPPKPKTAAEAYDGVFNPVAATSPAAVAPGSVSPTTPYRVSLVLFGGSDGASALSDVWHLSGFGPKLAWVPVEPSVARGAIAPLARQVCLRTQNKRYPTYMNTCRVTRVHFQNGSCY